MAKNRGHLSLDTAAEWLILFEDEAAVRALQESFARGPIVDDQGRRRLGEAQVARLGSLKIEIFAREHPPPHFRVSYQGDTASYRISDCTKINGRLEKFERNATRECHEI